MDHLQRSLLNYFTLQPLDRKAHRRVNPEWIREQLEHQNSCIYVLSNDSIVTRDNSPVILKSNHAVFDGLSSNRVFLGCDKQDIPAFALDIDDLGQLEKHFKPTENISLRDLADLIDSRTASILAYAKLLCRWHRTNRFCRRCGAGMASAQGGHVLECKNPDCGHIEFPRINPAVIMRVTCGDQILLARQQSWPANRYSVLAGFVEAGETLEHAVQREVMEEAGINVQRVEYHSSQPWPFPNSLMLGYCAWTDDMELDIESDDLETAVWVDPEELTHHMDDGSIILSPPISISHRLIEDWFMEKTGRSIKDWQVISPEHIR